MFAWLFNISIISLLIILILHFVFEYFGTTTKNTNAVDLQVQKYKTIIEKLTQQPPEVVAAFEEDTGHYPVSNDLEEDLELYIKEKTVDNNTGQLQDVSDTIGL